MNIEGTIKSIGTIQVISEKFKKREFVITTNDMYPKPVQFQLSNDKCDLTNNFKEGDAINVHFNLDGREWTNPQGEVKIFNTLSAWKIEAGSSNDAPPVGNHSTTVKTATVEAESDLPF